jgi:hypothetical protein
MGDQELISKDSSDNKLTIIDQTKIDEIETTYDEVISNLTLSADNSQQLIENLGMLAKASQNHNVFKALSEMIRTNNETNRDIINAAKAKQDLLIATKQDTPSSGSPTVVNNNLTLTTTELIDMIKSKNGVYTD